MFQCSSARLSFFRRSLVSGFVGAIILSFATAGKAEPPLAVADHYDKAGHPGLDSWLEDHFQTMMKSCVGNAFDSAKNRIYMESKYLHRKRYVTAIPSFLSTNLYPILPSNPQFVLASNGQSLTREFGYIYTDTEASALKEPVPGPASGFLDGVDYSSVADLTTSPGISSFTYKTDCTNALSSDIDLTGGYSFPVVAIKGGLDAHYSTSSSYALALVAGRFESPVVDTLNNVGGHSNPTARSVLAFEIWDWYAANPSRMPGATRFPGNNLLSYYDGVALYRETGLKQNTNFNANLSASTGVPGVVTLATANTLALSQITTSNAQAFQTATYLVSGKASRGYSSLPTPHQLANYISAAASAALDGVKSGDLTIVSSSSPPIKFYVDAYGIPDKDCPGLSPWTFSDNRVSVLSTGPMIDTEKHSYCEFTVQYSPAANDYLNGAVIAGTIDSGPLPAPSNEIAHIRLKPIAFASTINPQLQTAGINGQIAYAQVPAGATASSLSWSLTFRLVSDAAAARQVTSPAQIDVSGVYVDCAPGTFYPTSSPLTLSAPVQPNVSNLSWILSYQYQGTAANLAKPGVTKTCTLKGPVIYSLPAGKVSRSLPNVPIVFPVG